MTDKHSGKTLAEFTRGLDDAGAAFIEAGQKRHQVPVGARLLPKLKDALDAAAKKQGVSRNRLINEILAERFDVDISSLNM